MNITATINDYKSGSELGKVILSEEILEKYNETAQQPEGIIKAGDILTEAQMIFLGLVEEATIWVERNEEMEDRQHFRVKNDFGIWMVEGRDNNGMWVAVDPGATYDNQKNAEEAAEAWAENREGEFIGVIE